MICFAFCDIFSSEVVLLFISHLMVLAILSISEYDIAADNSSFVSPFIILLIAESEYETISSLEQPNIYSKKSRLFTRLLSKFLELSLELGKQEK